MPPRQRRRPRHWTRGLALAALAATAVCRPLAVMATSSEHQHHHDNTPHNNESNGSNGPSSEEGPPTSIWQSVTVWRFNETRGRAQYSISLCSATVDTMIFAFVCTDSTNTSALATATIKANAMADTFDSTRVERREITMGATVYVPHNYHDDDNSTKGTASGSSSAHQPHPEESRILYQVRFPKPTIRTRAIRCVDAVLNTSHEGAVALFAEYTAENVTVLVSDTQQQPVTFVACAKGCVNGNARTIRQRLETKNSADSTATPNWAGPILASLIIALTSLLGLLLLALGRKHVDVIVDYMMSFAAGCLLGVTFFHLYPEGSSYVADMGEWVAGACVLGGIAFSAGFELILHLTLASFGADACRRDKAAGDHGEMEAGADAECKFDAVVLESFRGSRSSRHISVLLQSLQSSGMMTPAATVTATHNGKHKNRDGGGAEEPPRGFRERYISSLRHVDPIAWITAAGDFCHAFTDGIVLAVAFRSCSTSMGWAVALGILLHEAPHRMGDFFIFLRAGMGIAQALVVNFVAALASLLGVLLVLGLGAVGDHTLGVLLALGAGALLFVALAKLLPSMLEARDAPRRALVHFLCFALGGLTIGLSMLQHTHCDGRGHIGDAANQHR